MQERINRTSIQIWILKTFLKIILSVKNSNHLTYWREIMLSKPSKNSATKCFFSKNHRGYKKFTKHLKTCHYCITHTQSNESDNGSLHISTQEVVHSSSKKYLLQCANQKSLASLPQVQALHSPCTKFLLV